MDNNLNRLSGLQAPQPSAEKKAAALAAAMAAFDATKKLGEKPQGSAARQRQSSIINKIWSFDMNRKFLAGSALATLLVVPVAGYVTMEVYHNQMAAIHSEMAPGGNVKKKAQKGTTEVVKTTDSEIAANNLNPVPQISSATPTNPNVADPAIGPVIATPQPGPDLSVAATGTEAVAPSTTADGVNESTKTETPAKTPAQSEAQGGLALKDVTIDSGFRAGKDTEVSGGLKREAADTAPMQGKVDAAGAVVPMEGDLSRNQSSNSAYKLRANEEMMPPVVAEPNGDKFSSKAINPVKSVAVEPVSTFSIDVDTASYAYTRQALTGGQLPKADSVRVEEMINYFPYDWKPPESADQAFQANITVIPTPWNANTRLMHIGIKGYEVAQAAQPPANLVFLIDVSGSMDEPNKLPLLKSAFRLLVGRLKPTDTVSIVTYAGNSGVVLEPTQASERQTILDAIDNLMPGGSTAGAEGINSAYQLAKKAFVKDGVNRVLLATDGDFNVGVSSDEELKSIIEQKRKSGIFLSVLGFGTGNYNDSLMQTLAQNGNGTAAYIDTLSEAQKTLVEEAGSSLFPIAKDVKIQVEFNPAAIAEYRLIGYETRALNRQDFNNDRIDAGEIGSGHRVTAIYEVTPKGSPAMMNDDLRYGKPEVVQPAVEQPVNPSGELAFVKIRYKKPNENRSQLVTMPVTEKEAVATIDAAPVDVRFSVAVAAFGQKLKGENQVFDYGYDRIIELATKSRGDDAFGYRAEFVGLVRLAKSLAGN